VDLTEPLGSYRCEQTPVGTDLDLGGEFEQVGERTAESVPGVGGEEFDGIPVLTRHCRYL
jgi:hypothetical protein